MRRRSRRRMVDIYPNGLVCLLLDPFVARGLYFSLFALTLPPLTVYCPVNKMPRGVFTTNNVVK